MPQIVENIRALHSNIIYRRLAKETISTAGILLPDTARYDNVVCEVVSVGPGALKDDGTREPMPALKPGDLIVLDQQSGRSLIGDLCICHSSEPWVIVEDYE